MNFAFDEAADDSEENSGNDVEWTSKSTVEDAVSQRPTVSFIQELPIPKYIVEMVSDESRYDPPTDLRYKHHKKLRELVEQEISKDIDKETVRKANKFLSSIKVNKREANKPMEELKTLFPALWGKILEEYELQGKKKKSDEKFLNLETRANSSKIRSLSNSLPLQMGVKVSNVDPKVMISLMAQYGNPKYLQVFEENSNPISLTLLDTVMLDAFQQSGKINERRGETAEDKKKRIENDKHVEKMSFEHDKMFNIIERMLQSEELKMTKTDSCINDIASGEEEQYKESAATKGKNFYPLAATRKRTQNEDSRCSMSFAYNIVPWWNTEHRTRYILDHWSVFPPGSTTKKSGGRGRSGRNEKTLSGSEAEYSDVIKEGGNALDSTFLMLNSSIAHCFLHNIVKEVLCKILNGNYDEEKLDAKTILEKKNTKSEIRNTLFGTGLLKSGKSAVHQELHIDDKDLMKEGETLQKALLGEYDSISAIEWLNCGYVIDMPLTKEGSWLRIAVPDKETKQFRMEIVFIPFGSFIVRSMCLFHSGHYGSPGNTRFHATLCIRNKKTNTAELGYIRMLKTIGFGDWKIKWCEHIEEKYKVAAKVKDYSSHEIAKSKGDGTSYWKEILKNEHAYRDTFIWMLNPTPPKERKRKKIDSWSENGGEKE